MPQKIEQPQNKQSQELAMAKQVLGRAKEMDLTSEQKEKVMAMIDSAKAEENVGNKLAAFKIYQKLLNFLEEKKESNEDQFEKKALSFLKEIKAKFEQKPEAKRRIIFYKSLLESLAGMDSEEAWELREDIHNNYGIIDSYLKSIAGLNSGEAWEIRNQNLNIVVKTEDNVLKRALGLSLAGLDSDRAWKMREKLILKDINAEDFLDSITCLDSEKAWKIRDEHSTKDRVFVLKSLAGIDSDRAWKMRQKLNLKGGVDSLEFIDTDQAWETRENFATVISGMSSNQTSYIVELLKSLQGLDSEKAWDLRDSLISHASSFLWNAIAESLASLDTERAWQMRDKLKKKVPESNLAKSVYGDWRTAAIRKARGIK